MQALKNIVISGAMILTLLFGLTLSASAENDDTLRMSDFSGKDSSEFRAISDAKAAQREIRLSKPTPEIGMHKSKIRNDTSWGVPGRIKTTVDADGTHEQWIYQNQRYLYFDNDKLTSIEY